MLRRPARQAARLPKEQRLIHVFMVAPHTLLVLGDPGTGKTRALLELARPLLDCAEQDESLPVPVAFNLAPWAGQPIASWLVEELQKRYLLRRRAVNG